MRARDPDEEHRAVAVLASTGLDEPVLATGIAGAALLAAAVVTEACRPDLSR